MGRGLIQRREHIQRPPFPHSSKNEAYPVLAVVSNRYPKPSGRSSTRYSPVRRCTQGRNPFLARLACVRHAASVQSEPESNSPVKIERRPQKCGLFLFANADFLPLFAIYLSKNRPENRAAHKPGHARNLRRKVRMHHQKNFVNRKSSRICSKIFWTFPDKSAKTDRRRVSHAPHRHAGARHTPAHHQQRG